MSLAVQWLSHPDMQPVATGDRIADVRRVVSLLISNGRAHWSIGRATFASVALAAAAGRLELTPQGRDEFVPAALPAVQRLMQLGFLECDSD